MNLDELERLDRARTQGHWRAERAEGDEYPGLDVVTVSESVALDLRANDAAFIAAAANSLGPLLKVIRAAERWSSRGSTKGCDAEIELADAVSELLYRTP